MDAKIISLRMERQCFINKADEDEYIKLYRDTQPGQNVYWSGFGFHGASAGHFRYGPYDLNDIVCDLPDAESRKDEIVKAVRAVNYGKMPSRFMGKEL